MGGEAGKWDGRVELRALAGGDGLAEGGGGGDAVAVEDLTGRVEGEAAADIGDAGAADAVRGAGRMPESAGRAELDWKTIWPIPVLAIATVLLIGGLVTAWVARPEPDPEAPLRKAAGLIEKAQYQHGLEVLNKEMLGFVRDGVATKAQAGEFFRMRAEAIFLGQAAMEIDRSENHRRIIENYELAEEQGLTLPAEDVERLALTHLALNRPFDAAALLPTLAEREEPGEGRRRRLIRRIVEHNLAAGGSWGAEDAGGAGRAADAGGGKLRDLTMGLLNTLSLDPKLPLEDRLWTAAREAELRLDEGAAREAATDLVRDILLLEPQVGRGGLAELHLLLGRAYFHDGVHLDKADEAARTAEEAFAARPDTEGLAAAIVLRGQIAQAQGQADLARERFGRVRAELAGTNAHAATLLGLAETEAQLGNHVEASEAYAELVDRARRAVAERARPSRSDVSRQRICESLMDRHRERYLAGAAAGDAAKRAEAFRTALAYAELADSLFAAEDVPSPVLLAMAETHRRLAEGMLTDAAGRRLDHRAIRALDPVTQSQAKQHLMHAGRFYLAYADRVLLESNQNYLDALWLAADSYDLGGALDDAADAFSRYYDGALAADQRRPEARFRLAQIFRARRDYAAATPLYKELIDSRPGGPNAAKGVGVWADAAIVPLAQCYLADDDEANDEEAARLLRSIVEGSILEPDAIEFREAVVELATLEYRHGRYAEAARLFTEAVERYPDHERLTLLQYRLADSYRLLAAQLAATLREAMPAAERQQREAAHRDALTQARRLFGQVRTALTANPAQADEARPPLTELEKLHLRNAAFYIGDCAFDLGAYEEAIRAYGEAAEQYARDPSSLVAKVQIVNAYVALKQWDNARTAQERARQHYENLTRQFGDRVWEDPTLPMEQKHWERWLSSGRRLDAPQASAEEG